MRARLFLLTVTGALFLGSSQGLMSATRSPEVERDEARFALTARRLAAACQRALDRGLLALRACDWDTVPDWNAYRFAFNSPHDFEYISWPLPRPDGVADVTQSIAARRTFGAISGGIVTRLRERGYDSFDYFAVPGGFALATRLERFEGDGRPAAQNRFHVGQLPRARGFTNYLGRLIWGGQGRVRLLMFVVTNRPFSFGRFQANQEDMRRWASVSNHALPELLAAARAGPATRVSLLIYEFQPEQGRGGGVRSTPDPVSVSLHRSFLGM